MLRERATSFRIGGHVCVEASLTRAFGATSPASGRGDSDCCREGSYFANAFTRS